MKNLIILLLFSFVFQGCTLIPCDSVAGLDTVDDVPKDSELTGTYLPDKMTIESIPGFTAKSKLILMKDHTFRFENFPESTFSFDAVYGGAVDLVRGAGEWDCHDADYTAKLAVNVGYEKPGSSNSSKFITSWNLYQLDDKYTIFIVVGDPDECAGIRLVKK